MKKILALSALLQLFIFPSIAQERHSEKITPLMEIGAGLSMETSSRDMHATPGLASEFSFGLDLQISNQWSILPMVGANILLGDFLSSNEGNARDYTHAFANASVLLRYHSSGGIAIGIGPALYYNLCNDLYISGKEYGGKQVLKPLDYGLRAKITNDLGTHWLIGVQTDIGLRNMLVQYPEYGISGTDHLHSIYIIAGFRF